MCFFCLKCSTPYSKDGKETYNYNKKILLNIFGNKICKEYHSRFKCEYSEADKAHTYIRVKDYDDIITEGEGANCQTALGEIWCKY